MINPALLQLLMRDAKQAPLGKVLCLGRQSIIIFRDRFVEMAHKENFPLLVEPSEIPHTFDDVYLFKTLLGAESIESLDYKGEEGAPLIYNLNEPLPEELHGKFDYIVDGGTFDHLFDLRQAFENMVNLLSDNGRIFHWNAADRYFGFAYIQYSPDIFHDYYMGNGFKSCDCFLLELDLKVADEPHELWKWNKTNGLHQTKRHTMTVVKAQKQKGATTTFKPTQYMYGGTSDKPFELVEILG